MSIPANALIPVADGREAQRVIAELPHDLLNLAVGDIEAHLGRMMTAS